MAGKNHQLKYRYADWEVIEERQERRWASKASDITITKPDGSVVVVPNKSNPKNLKRKKKGYAKKRQQMFDGNSGV
jgi:hypothetical protein